MVVEFMGGNQLEDFNFPWNWQTVVRQQAVIKNSEIWPNIEMAAWWDLDLLCQCLHTSPTDYTSVGLAKIDFKPSESSPLVSSIPIWYAWVSVSPGKIEYKEEGWNEGECETKRVRKKKVELNLGETLCLQAVCQYEHMLRSVHM